MQNSALVSVIIPCYNHENFVQDCIQSIINQDYQNIELIIIDDGSKDNSVQKIEEMVPLCKERFTRFEFRHRPNKGLCRTLNEALEWVRGEYLSTVASDDIWVKEKTTLQAQYLDNNPDSVAVFGNITLIDEYNNIIQEYKMPFKRHRFEDIFLHRFYIPTPTNMARTKDIKKTGGYNPNFIIEDWYMWLKLAESGKFLDCLPETLAYYRRHDDNLSSKAILMHKGRLEIAQEFSNHKKYKRALKNIYYIVFAETEKININLILNAIIDIPYFIFSLRFWKKSLFSKSKIS